MEISPTTKIDFYWTLARDKNLNAQKHNAIKPLGKCGVKIYPAQTKSNVNTSCSVKQRRLFGIDTPQHHGRITIVTEVDEVAIVSKYLSVLQQSHNNIANKTQI